MNKEIKTVKMRRKPIVFDTKFEVYQCEEITIIPSMCGDIIAYPGDYIFIHPEGDRSKVSKDNIKDFEVIHG